MKVRQKKFTAKLKEVVLLFAEDCDVPAIIERTGLFYRTIEKRIERARVIPGAKHPQGMVAEAHRRGFIDLGRKLKMG